MKGNGCGRSATASSTSEPLSMRVTRKNRGRVCLSNLRSSAKKSWQKLVSKMMSPGHGYLSLLDPPRKSLSVKHTLTVKATSVPLPVGSQVMVPPRKLSWSEVIMKGNGRLFRSNGANGDSSVDDGVHTTDSSARPGETQLIAAAINRSTRQPLQRRTRSRAKASAIMGRLPPGDQQEWAARCMDPRNTICGQARVLESVLRAMTPHFPVSGMCSAVCAQENFPVPRPSGGKSTPLAEGRPPKPGYRRRSLVERAVRRRGTSVGSSL